MLKNMLKNNIFPGYPFKIQLDMKVDNIGFMKNNLNICYRVGGGESARGTVLASDELCRFRKHYLPW